MGSGFRTFQSGEVLTSSNVQNYLMDQSVMVFAGTAARGSAIASPETGMVSYRTDGTADSKREGFEFYDGASWTRLVPATTTSGLELISSTTIGSAVSSVTVSNAFSSTYDNYRITVYGGAGSGALNIGLTLGSAATGYYRWGTFGGYSATSVSGLSGNNAASWSDVVYASTNSIHGQIELYGPNVAKNTYMNAIAPQSVTSSGPVLQAGFLNDSTQYTAFTLTCVSGTITGGTIRVYGYKN